MPASLSHFASTLTVETAFNVLAKAKQLGAKGKTVIELEIGDSPFPSTKSAKTAGIAAIQADRSHYCPSAGIPEMREAASDYVNCCCGLKTKPENIVVAHGAKVMELLFCETFLNPDDGVLVFSPYFPTYVPNILRRGARACISDLKQENEFRPSLKDVKKFLAEDPHPKAIFLNSPHNPTGGIATEEDLRELADLIRDRDVAVFSDEPYDQMVWRGRHHSLLEQAGMFGHCVAAYTFSKTFSMSGWRLGFAVARPEIANMFAQLINSCLSCTPPLVQLAGVAALKNDLEESRATMRLFREKVELLVKGLNTIKGIQCLDPAGTFYVFPRVAPICNDLKITSHGLAMYLLEAADDQFGVACLGGECFGAAGGGFLRFSCAEPNERLQQALEFLPKAFSRRDRVGRFLQANPQFRLKQNYNL